MLPYVVIGSAKQGPVRGDGDAGDRHVLLGDQLVGAAVLGEVPDPHAA